VETVERNPEVRPQGIPIPNGDGLPLWVRALPSQGIVFGVFLLFGILFTLPGSLSPRSALLGYPGDNFQHAWFLWHFAWAVTRGHNPFYTRLMFYPNRVNLTWSTTDPLGGLLSLPLSLTLGPIGAYNLSLILQLALTAFFARLLCLRITKNEMASFLGGMVFGFSPFLMAHALGHLSLVTAFPIPLFVLLLDRILTENKPSWKRGMFLGLALLLAAFAHYNYVVLCLMLAVCWFAVDLLAESRSERLRTLRRVWKPLAIATLTFAAAFSPMLWVMLAGRSQVPAARSLDHIEQFSADALGFLIPSWNHVLLGAFAKRMNPRIFIGGFEGTVYVGMPLLLAAFGFWAGRRAKLRWASRAAVLGIIFYLLSLGPAIRVLGHQLSLPGPAALFYELPFSQFMSAPARFQVIVALCVAILSSLALKFLLERYDTQHGRVLITSVSIILILCDYLTIPFPRSSIMDPGTLASSGETGEPRPPVCALPDSLRHGTVLTFPLVKTPYCLKSMCMQMADGGRYALIDGYLSYTPDYVWTNLSSVRIIRSLMALGGLLDAPVDIPADRRSASDDIRRLNLSAIVVFDSPEHDAAVSYIEGVLGAARIRQKGCTIFPVQP
jgi:hypothetical protein